MKALKTIGIIVLCIALIICIINIIPPAKNLNDNPFLVDDGDYPMVAAHRGGAQNSPENTMLAFRTCVNETKVDIVETDVHLTKDGYLVYVHDAYIDRVCDINGDIDASAALEICEEETKRHYVSDMTLDELKQYNFGYYFEDENGNRPYKDVKDLKKAGLQIATIDELFEEFKDNQDILFLIEIKDGDEMGKTACKIVHDTLENYPQFKQRLVIGTVHSEVENELRENYPEILRGASTGSAAKFIATQLLKVNLFDNTSFACLQVPTSYDVGITLKLDKETYIKRAHKRNIAVQFWTINEESQMRELIDLKCDCIMTDNPVLLNKVLNDYE